MIMRWKIWYRIKCNNKFESVEAIKWCFIVLMSTLLIILGRYWNPYPKVLHSWESSFPDREEENDGHTFIFIQNGQKTEKGESYFVLLVTPASSLIMTGFDFV